jgi:hypothetical protein
MAELRTTGGCRAFPPEGSELVSWVVAMSYGFILQLRVEPDEARALDRARGRRPGGAFRHQVSPSYDVAPIAADLERRPAQ